MNSSELKDFVYGQIAQIGKAVSSPKRLELLDLLCQGEKTVETLADRADISIKLVSAHLKELRAARLVESRKEGKYVIYRVSGCAVAELWVKLREIAESQFSELPGRLAEHVGDPSETTALERKVVLEKARRGEIVLIDVRPEDEFSAGHLPYALCIPLEDLRKRLSELPRNKEIVTYCKGSHCLQANEAVKLLRKRGYKATRLHEGMTDWRAEGVTLEK